MTDLCHYCRTRPADSLDHIVPRSLMVGPRTSRRNLVGACRPCNSAKARRRVEHECERCDSAWALYGRRGRWGADITSVPLDDLLAEAEALARRTGYATSSRSASSHSPTTTIPTPSPTTHPAMTGERRP